MTRRPPGPTFPPPHIDLCTEFEAAFERPYPGLCRDNAIEWLTLLLQERDRLRGLIRELPMTEVVCKACRACMAERAAARAEAAQLRELVESALRYHPGGLLAWERWQDRARAAMAAKEPPDEPLDLELLRKMLEGGSAGRRTGALKRAGLLEFTVTAAGLAALAAKERPLKMERSHE